VKPAVLPLLPELETSGLQITHGFTWFHRGLLSAAIPSLNRKTDFELIGERIKSLSTNPDFNGTQSVLVYFPHLQLVVTLALILTFSPGEKGQRLHGSLYAVVCRANPAAGAWWFRGFKARVCWGKSCSGPPFSGRGSQAQSTSIPAKFSIVRHWFSAMIHVPCRGKLPAAGDNGLQFHARMGVDRP